MDNRLQPYYETITAKNLTVNEVLTLASLVEKKVLLMKIVETLQVSSLTA